jgi:hypothetical protein
MITKIYKLIIALLVVTFITSNITEAQTTTATTKKDIYPVFSMTPVVGVQFPVGTLNDTYRASFNGGLDFNMKVNKETSFFFKAGYYDLPIKTELQGQSVNYIEITAGPRYIFSGQNIKAQFFLEAGAGVYIFNMKEYTNPTTNVMTPSSSSINFGANAGPGVFIPLSKTLDLMLKSKIHYVFQEEGSRTFLGSVIGIDFRL